MKFYFCPLKSDQVFHTLSVLDRISAPVCSCTLPTLSSVSQWKVFWHPPVSVMHTILFVKYQDEAEPQPRGRSSTSSQPSLHPPPRPPSLSCLIEWTDICYALFVWVRPYLLQVNSVLKCFMQFVNEHCSNPALTSVYINRITILLSCKYVGLSKNQTCDVLNLQKW